MDEVERLVARVTGALSERAAGLPYPAFEDFAEGAAGGAAGGAAVSAPWGGVAGAVFAGLREALGGGAAAVLGARNEELMGMLARGREGVAPVMAPFTPDHIVYCKARFLYLDEGDVRGGASAVAARAEAFRAEAGYAPRVALAQGLGAFLCGAARREAEDARALFLDALAIAAYARFFGGPSHMPEDLVAFIENWEVESYRARMSRG
jgi:hypothetical protein